VSLFKDGKFTAHSGKELGFKIDCDALTDEDWATMASLAASRQEFGRVVGIPSGGLKFAAALEKHVTPGHEVILIVDDVMTTGGSMDDMRKKVFEEVPSGIIEGIALFSRADVIPYWIRPIFQLKWPFLDR
jgi:orotate phosphoribosyltransferase